MRALQQISQLPVDLQASQSESNIRFFCPNSPQSMVHAGPQIKFKRIQPTASRDRELEKRNTESRHRLNETADRYVYVTEG